jgi:hypothetical protein
MCNDLTIVCCSYNTPDVFELCLKSFVFHHGNGPHRIVIIENSTGLATQELLDLNNIPYLKNPGGTHSLSVELGLGLVKTRYALLIDTDVLFKQPIDAVFRFFQQQQFTLLGEVQADRGGFLLYPRVAPYFCLIDMAPIRSAKIRFHDEERIKRTRSDGFFKHIPINYEQKHRRYYDVGSVFYENVKKNNFQIGHLKNIADVVFHAESLSWALQTGLRPYTELGKQRQEAFYNTAMQYKGVEIRNCFEEG